MSYTSPRIVAVAVVAVAVVVIVTLAQGGGDAGASGVRVFERGGEGQETLGTYDEEEALAVAESEGDFAPLIPTSLPDSDLQLSSITLIQNPVNGETHRTVATYTVPGDPESGDEMRLSLTSFRPGQDIGFNTPPEAEEVDLGHSLVYVLGPAGESSSRLYAVRGELDFQIETSQVDHEAVIAMIDEMAEG